MAHWSASPARRLREQLEEADKVLDLSIDGIRRIERMVPLATALHEFDRLNASPEKLEDSQKKLEITSNRAELARREVEQDFPLLHANALVGAWGALEASVEDLAVAVVQNDQDVRTSEALSRVKISFVEYETLDADERVRLVVSELQRGLHGDQRLGAQAFELLLGRLGLGGPVDESVGRDIFELQQLRHVIVHRRRNVDRRLVERCPWLGLTVGAQLRISHEQYVRLVSSVAKYFLLIMARVRDKYSLERAV